ncbi:MAG: hypothetical protein LC751_11175, partial [Actinobacteria bacterium]|nr:hypothetical protein [Actinomycetota bacterium]
MHTVTPSHRLARLAAGLVVVVAVVGLGPVASAQGLDVSVTTAPLTTTLDQTLGAAASVTVPDPGMLVSGVTSGVLAVATGTLDPIIRSVTGTVSVGT